MSVSAAAQAILGTMTADELRHVVQRAACSEIGARFGEAQGCGDVREAAAARLAALGAPS